MTRSNAEIHACKRCGITRTIRAGRDHQTLCRDCKDVLSTEERHEWTRPAEQKHSPTADMRADIYFARLEQDPVRVYRLLDEEFKPSLAVIRQREYEARTERLRQLIHTPERQTT